MLSKTNSVVSNNKKKVDRLAGHLNSLEQERLERISREKERQKTLTKDKGKEDFKKIVEIIKTYIYSEDLTGWHKSRGYYIKVLDNHYYGTKYFDTSIDAWMRDYGFKKFFNFFSLRSYFSLHSYFPTNTFPGFIVTYECSYGIATLTITKI
jgi:hypothetical protein